LHKYRGDRTPFLEGKTQTRVNNIRTKCKMTGSWPD